MEKEKKFKKFCCKVQTALSSFSPTFKFPTASSQHTSAVRRDKMRCSVTSVHTKRTARQLQFFLKRADYYTKP